MNPLSSLPSVSPYSSGVGSSSSSASSPSISQPGSQHGSQYRSATPADEPHNAGKKVGGLDEAQLKELTELKARDREVRAHEAAHQATGGQHAGAMSLTYQRGPDGAQYAVGGEVSIDMSSVDGNPQATIEKMRAVRAAAMAPAEPSSQDRAVAAQAMQVMLQAQSELSLERPTLAGQQARDTYQDIAAFGPEPASGMDGFLSISV